MSRLWVPPRVDRKLREETVARDEATKAMFDLTGQPMDAWNVELRKIDPLLALGRAKERAAAPGVIAGYYHLLRFNEGAPMSVMPLHGPDGEFAEPSSQMLETLRAADLQNPRAVRDRQRLDEQQEAARVKGRETAHEERVEEAMGRWKAATETSVSMNSDTPWTQGVAGRRGRKAA